MKRFRVYKVMFALAGFVAAGLAAIAVAGILTHQSNAKLNIEYKWSDDDTIYVQYNLRVINHSQSPEIGWNVVVAPRNQIEIKVKDYWKCEVEVGEYMVIKPLETSNAEIPAKSSVDDIGFILEFPKESIPDSFVKKEKPDLIKVVDVIFE